MTAIIYKTSMIQVRKFTGNSFNYFISEFHAPHHTHFLKELKGVAVVSHLPFPSILFCNHAEMYESSVQPANKKLQKFKEQGNLIYESKRSNRAKSR